MMIPSSVFDAFEADSGEILKAAADLAGEVSPGIPVTTESHRGVIVPVLLGMAERASLAVIGSRGLGGFSGLLVGSVGWGWRLVPPARWRSSEAPSPIRPPAVR